MMILSALPLNFGAYATEKEPSVSDPVIQSGSFEYKSAQDNKTLCITKYVGEDEVVSIPTQIDGMTVSTISDKAFENNEIVKEVYIPETITNVEITCMRYDDQHFGKPVRITTSVIGANPFVNCKNLEKIEVSPDNEYFSSIDGVLFTKVEYSQTFFWDDKHFDQLVLLCYPNAKQDSEYTVPKNVRYIGSRIDMIDMQTECVVANAFAECPALKKITISDNVQGIKYGEFFNQDITIYGYEDTTAYLYAEFYSLPFIMLDPIGKATEDTAYLDDPDFEYEVTMENELMVVKYKGTGDVANVPEWVGDRPVTEISNRAFDGCTSLRKVTFPDSLTAIETGAFRDCTALADVTLPDSLQYVSGGAFRGTPWLDAQPDGILYLGKTLWYVKGKYDKGLVIEDGTEMIADYAFDGCESLFSVTLPASVKRLKSSVFSDTAAPQYLEILNPECDIPMYDYAIPASAVICGYMCSTADVYAAKFGRRFIALDYGVPGDVDMDGKPTVLDITLVQRKEAEMVTLSDKQFRKADVNGDGKVNILDATFLQRALAEMVILPDLSDVAG